MHALSRRYLKNSLRRHAKSGLRKRTSYLARRRSWEQARRVVSALLEQGVLASEGTRAPLRLAFSAKLASRWMPGLCPDKTD